MFNAKSVILLFIVGAVIGAASCREMLDQFHFGSVQTRPSPIGVQGGQVSSDQGLLTIDFPAGAFSTTTLIGVSRLSAAQLSGPVETLNPVAGWDVAPTGAQLNLPATVTIHLDLPSGSSTGNLSVELPRVVVLRNGTIEFASMTTVEAHIAQGSMTVTTEILQLGRIVVVNPGAGGVQIGFQYPTTISAFGPVPIDATFHHVGGITDVVWSASSTGNLEISPFDGMFGPPGIIFDPLGGAQLVEDSFDMDCGPNGGGGSFSVTLSMSHAHPQNGTPQGITVFRLLDSLSCSE